MTNPERDIPGSREFIITEVGAIDRAIATILRGRIRGNLSEPEMLKVEDLDSRKSKQLLEALNLKLAGDETIRILVHGNIDHPYGRNQVEIEFMDAETVRYVAKTYMTNLRMANKGNEVQMPIDQILDEQPREFIVRTINEIKEIDHFLGKARDSKDIAEQEFLTRLKVSLAELLLEKWAEKDPENGSISVELIERGTIYMNLIQLTYEGSRGLSFRVLHPSALRFPTRLESLIQLGGGYDRVVKEEFTSRGREQRRR